MDNVLDIKTNRIFLVKSGNNLRAFVDIVVAGSLIIKGIKVVNGKNGLFVSMPQEKNTKSDKWFPTVRCVDTETRDRVSDVVLKAYESKASQN